MRGGSRGQPSCCHSRPMTGQSDARVPVCPHHVQPAAAIRGITGARGQVRLSDAAECGPLPGACPRPRTPAGSLAGCGWRRPAAHPVVAAVQVDRAPAVAGRAGHLERRHPPVPDLCRLAGIDAVIGHAVTGSYYLLMTAGSGCSATRGRRCGCRRCWPWPRRPAHRRARPPTGRRAVPACSPVCCSPSRRAPPGTARRPARTRSATLLAVLATLLLVGALDRPTWRRWAGYAVAVLGAGAGPPAGPRPGRRARRAVLVAGGGATGARLAGGRRHRPADRC